MKIAIIIAFEDFRDEEYFIPKSEFENANFQVKTFSTRLGEALGVFGGTTSVDAIIDDLNVADFDAIIFVGGRGAKKYIEDKKCWEIAKEAVAENKILGAICIAPAILARAGVLENKMATVWSSEMDKSAIKILKEGKAKYIEKDVVKDGNIITANGPESARKFAKEIISLLEEKELQI
ncbi:MAG: DJ-1/PfpI family protein [Minisyncoccia bacterium]